jgi:hypothetical protein
MTESEDHRYIKKQSQDCLKFTIYYVHWSGLNGMQYHYLMHLCVRVLLLRAVVLASGGRNLRTPA